MQHDAYIIKYYRNKIIEVSGEFRISNYNPIGIEKNIIKFRIYNLNIPFRWCVIA